MRVDEQLAGERRAGPRQATIAALAAALLVGAAAVQLSGPHTKVNELTLDLITAHKRYPLDLIGSILNGIGLVALAATLVYLFSLTQSRNPEVKPFIRWVAIFGGVIAGLTGIVYSVVIAGKASDFIHHGNQTFPEADHLTRSGGLLALPFLGQAAALALAVGFVLVALQAMRVGLLTRFMGYLGIFTGVLVLFPIGSPVPVVQAFWLLALAFMFTGRWPQGLPPTWHTGKPEPWPSSAELRQQRAAAGPQRGGRATGAGPLAGAGKRGKPESNPAPTETLGATPAPRTRSSTPKRKRKRRH